MYQSPPSKNELTWNSGTWNPSMLTLRACYRPKIAFLLKCVRVVEYLWGELKQWASLLGLISHWRSKHTYHKITKINSTQALQTKLVFGTDLVTAELSITICDSVCDGLWLIVMKWLVYRSRATIVTAGGTILIKYLVMKTKADWLWQWAHSLSEDLTCL